jgi:hypothetical protein
MGSGSYIFIAAGAVLAILLCFGELRRRNRKNIILRIAACILAAASLTCIALPITYNHNTVSSGIAIITTQGYRADSVALLKKQTGSKTPVFSFDDFLSLANVNYKTLHIAGYGLTPAELQQLPEAQVIFHPQIISTGIIAVHWRQILHSGEKLIIQGMFSNKSNTPIKLLLKGFGSAIDSCTATPAGVHSFQLSATPQQSGKAVFYISAIQGNTILEENPVPINVLPPLPLKVLMLASAPGFENRFLKNWLSANGFAVVTRSTTSKNKFSNSFINTPQKNIAQITAPVLDSFDVVLCDAAEYAALTGNEQRALQLQVQQGMGLIINADTSLPAEAFYSPGFPLYSTNTGDNKAIALRLANGVFLHNYTGGTSLYIRPQQGMQVLAADSVSSQIVAGVLAYGAGKIAVTTLAGTYKWVLAGKSHDYFLFWSTLLGKTAKSSNANAMVTYSPPFPVVHQPVQITVESTGLPQLTVSGTPVYLQQQTGLAFNWNGTYWPRDTGWHTAATQYDTATFYVYNNVNWQYVRAAAKITITDEYSRTHSNTQQYIKPVTENAPASKFYFALLLVVCCTFLWIERKFNG